MLVCMCEKWFGTYFRFALTGTRERQPHPCIATNYTLYYIAWMESDEVKAEPSKQITCILAWCVGQPKRKKGKNRSMLNFIAVTLKIMKITPEPRTEFYLGAKCDTVWYNHKIDCQCRIRKCHVNKNTKYIILRSAARLRKTSHIGEFLEFVNCWRAVVISAVKAAVTRARGEMKNEKPRGTNVKKDTEREKKKWSE